MRTNLPQPYEHEGLPATSPPALYPGFEDEEEGGLDFRRLVAAVLRHKWLVIGVTLVAAAAGFLGVRMLPDEYVAQSTVWIEGGEGGESGPIRSAELLSAGSWVELLRSFVILDHVVMQQRLFLTLADPADSTLFDDFEIGEEFVPGSYRLEADRTGRQYHLVTAEGQPVESVAWGTPVGRKVGFQWQPPAAELRDGEEVAFTVRSPREAAVQLRNSLTTQMDRNGNFLRIEMQGASPTRIAGTVNALAQRLVEVAGDLKRAKLDELTKILEEQLAYAESNLQGAERDLESFRVGTITLPADRAAPVSAGLEITRDPVFSRFFDLRMELEQTRQDRQAIQSALAGQGGGLSQEALEVIPSVRNASQLMGALGELTQAKAELRALRYRYTEQHPPVQEKAAQVQRLEQEIVPGLARGLAQELAARERAIEQQIQSASSELEQIPPRAIEEARLRRQVAVTEGLYTDLQHRYEEARLAAASSIPDLRVLDRAAVPQNPVQDQKNMFLLMAVAGGLALGLFGALLRDRFDPTIRYADQVTEEMGLTVLGAVPQLGNGKGARRHDSTAEALEAFRSIRLNVLHAYGSAGPVVLAVSSPGPGDGKSLVTSNLALSFGELGRRVLVIDGDIRRGTLHRVLDRTRGPGLLEYLKGTASRQAIVQRTDFTNVSFLASGQPSRQGPEMISSPRMRDLLADLKSEYDVILIDTAPLGAGVDPFVFGTLTGNLLLVLRTGSTDRALAEAKLKLAGRLPVRLLGVVLNGLQDSDHTYYHRYYSYLPGYESVAEDDSTAALPKA